MLEEVEQVLTLMSHRDLKVAEEAAGCSVKKICNNHYLFEFFVINVRRVYFKRRSYNKKLFTETCEGGEWG